MNSENFYQKLYGFLSLLDSYQIYPDYSKIIGLINENIAKVFSNLICIDSKLNSDNNHSASIFCILKFTNSIFQNDISTLNFSQFEGVCNINKKWKLDINYRIQIAFLMKLFYFKFKIISSPDLKIDKVNEICHTSDMYTKYFWRIIWICNNFPSHCIQIIMYFFLNNLSELLKSIFKETQIIDLNSINIFNRYLYKLHLVGFKMLELAGKRLFGYKEFLLSEFLNQFTKKIKEKISFIVLLFRNY